MKEKLGDVARGAAGWYRVKRGKFYALAQYAAPLALLLLLLALRFSGQDWVQLVQHRAFDEMMRLNPRPYQAVPVRVIDIDDESLARLGQWPWPRTTLARVVRRLNELGAASIVFDAVFAEPDRSSPARAAASWPSTPEAERLKAAAARLPDNDEAFAAAMKGAGVVTGFALTGQKNAAMPRMKAAMATAGDDPARYLEEYAGAVVNIPALEKASAGNGNFGFQLEADGVVRRVPLLFKKDGAVLPALSLEALRVAQEVPGFAVKSSGGSGEIGGHTGIVKIKVGDIVIPTDGSGKVWVYFTRYAPQRTVPVWKIFEKDFSPDSIRGNVTFIGTSAAGLKDLRVTPLDPALPGVEVHANLVEQALQGKFLNRPDWAEGVEAAYMLLLGLLLALLLPRFGAMRCAMAGAAGVALALYASWKAFTGYGYLLDPVFPVLSVLAVYMVSSLINYLRSETERRQVRSAFSRYMHPKMVEELAKHPEKLTLGGETREMTILFCDIRGFTTISEQYDAHGLTTVITRFLTPMTDIIMQRMGYIDKYIGDCIMAFWNAPLDDADHAANACESALTMQETLAALNEKWKAEAEAEGRKHLPINIGVGLNSGPCCVGNMGSEQRFNYSVLGDDVNLASRLEGQSKAYGVGIIIGPLTREKAPGFAALELDLIKVKGKTRPVRIFALLGRADMADDGDFKKLEADHKGMLDAYRARDWDAAGKALAACRAHKLFDLHKLYDMYEERLKAYRAAPPPPDWDGSYTATSK